MSRSTKSTHLFLAMILALAWGPLSLGATEIYEGDVNDWNHDATDYHIEIKSDGPIGGVGGVLSDDGEFPHTFIHGEGTNHVIISWLIDAPPGDAIGFCIEFEAPEGYRVDKSFTAVKGTVELKLPVLGGSVKKDGSHALTNGYHLPIRYTNAQYTVQREALAESHEDAARMLEGVAQRGGGFERGWISLPDGEVPAKGETHLLDGVGTPGGESLFIYYEAAFEDHPSFARGFTVIREPRLDSATEPADRPR